VQVKALKGPNIVGLGMGGLAPGELPTSEAIQQLPAPARPLALQAPDDAERPALPDVQGQAMLVHEA
jgi:hypothetical protein